MRGPRRAAVSVLFCAALVAAAGAAPATDAASTTGWLDPTFGVRGVARVPWTSASIADCGQTIGLAVAPTGRIFVGANRCGSNPTFQPSEVTAFGPAGRRDYGFHKGKTLIVGGGDGASGGVVDIFATAAGGLVRWSSDPASTCAGVAQYPASGSPNPTFNLCVPHGTFFEGRRMTRLPGGSIRACLQDFWSPNQMQLSGLTPSGQLDTRLGPNGYRSMNLGYCSGFTSDSAGHLYWVARRWLGDGRAVADVTRLNSSGTVDSAWGTGGTTTIEVAGRHLKPTGHVIAAADGSLYVGLGVSDAPTGAPWTAAIAKLTPSGALDAAFGTAGTRVYAPTNGTSRLLALTADASGRPILSVTFTMSGSTHAYLLRGLASNGALDPAFGVGGLVAVSRPVVDLATAGAHRILSVSDVDDGLILSARTN